MTALPEYIKVYLNACWTCRPEESIRYHMELGLGVTLSHHVDADNKCSLLLRQLLNGTIALLKTHSSLSI